MIAHPTRRWPAIDMAGDQAAKRQAKPVARGVAYTVSDSQVRWRASGALERGNRPNNESQGCFWP